MVDLDLDFSDGGAVPAAQPVTLPAQPSQSETIPSPPAGGIVAQPAQVAPVVVPPQQVVIAPAAAPVQAPVMAAAVPQFGPAHDEDEVTFGDKKVELSNYARFKGRLGTDVVGIVSSKLKRAYQHFHRTGPKSGVTFRCLSQRDARGTVLKSEICCTMLGLARQVFGLVLFHYNSDQNGTLTAPDHPMGKLELWILSEPKYEDISGIHVETPVLDGYTAQPGTRLNPSANKIVVPPGPTALQYDLKIKCTDVEWQRMTYTALPNALWKRKPEWYDQIKKLAAVAQVRLNSSLGLVKTAQEVQQLLAASSAPSGSPAMMAGAVDTSDLGINLTD